MKTTIKQLSKERTIQEIKAVNVSINFNKAILSNLYSYKTKKEIPSSEFMNHIGSYYEALPSTITIMPLDSSMSEKDYLNTLNDGLNRIIYMIETYQNQCKLYRNKLNRHLSLLNNNGYINPNYTIEELIIPSLRLKPQDIKNILTVSNFLDTQTIKNIILELASSYSRFLEKANDYRAIVFNSNYKATLLKVLLEIYNILNNHNIY